MVLFVLLSCLNISSFSFLSPVYSPLPQSIPILLSIPWVMHVCSLTNPFTFFQIVPSSLLPFDSVLLVSLFCSLDSTYKWDHTEFVFHQQVYLLSVIVSSSIILSQKVRISYFLLLFSIPLYEHTTVFTHSCTDGHLACLQILATINNAATNIGCIYSFELVFRDS